MFRYLIILFLLCSLSIHSQEQDADLIRIREKLERVSEFSANLTLELDVPFINMPTKNAQMNFNTAEGTTFESSDFIFLPKRGLDFSLSELFKYPFITVGRGMETIRGQSLKLVNVIPTSEDSPLALAAVSIDTTANRIVFSQITTKTQGAYDLYMEYEDQTAILPNFVEVSFAIERLKIPLNFMGRDTDIDRKQMRKMDTKTGKIMMNINYSEIIMRN